uniref:Uncharacterized protein n=1 Tax=Oryza glaberrima TaxID=4538 RepID=I1Q4W1_ORYGL
CGPHSRTAAAAAPIPISESHGGVVGARVSPPLRRRRDAFAREADEQSAMSKKVSIGKNITAYGWPICKRI